MNTVWMFTPARLRRLPVCLAVLLILPLVMLPAAAGALELRFAEFGPNRGTRAQALEWFAEELARRTDGALTINFHWGKALLGTGAVLKGVGDGVADMGSIVGFLTPKELYYYNIGDLPMDNSDEWVGMRAIHALSTTDARLMQEFADNNVSYITNYTTGPIQLICTRPVPDLGAVRGLKVRGSGPYGKTMTAMGAVVERMGQPAVYQALDSGLIECNQNYYYSMRAYKQYEVAQHVVELDWGQNLSFGIIMNQDVFNGLPAAQQQVLRELGSDFIDHFARLMIEGRAADRQAMVQGIDGKRIDITHWPAKDRARLIQAGEASIKEWLEGAAALKLDGQAVYEHYLRLIDRFAKRKAEKGYPWR